MLSMMAAIHGMIVLTLSVSFILTILQTTMEARGLAARCNALIGFPNLDQSTAALWRLGSLGGDMAMLAVKLSASPLPGMFVPSDPTMNFPETVARVCNLLEKEAAVEAGHFANGNATDELEAAFDLIGRHSRADGSSKTFGATMAWAARFSFAPWQNEST